MLNFIRRRRKLILACVDLATMVIASLLAFLVTNVIIHLNIRMNIVYDTCILLMACMLFGLWLMRVYNNIWRYAVVGDFIGCCVGILIGTLLYYATSFLLNLHMSDIIIVLTALVSIIGVIMTRVCYSYIFRVLRGNNPVSKGKRTLIVGAGDAGNKVITEMKMGDGSPYNPVAIVDDDESKKGRNLMGVPVVGKTKNIPALAAEMEIEVIVIAMPSVGKEEKKRILSICSETVCEVKNVPYVHELLSDCDLLGQARKINIEDLLGRDVVTMTCDNSKQLITGKVCVVTGGGGSIGSELCRQVAAYNPEKLVIVDIYENNAYDIQQELLIKYGKNLNLDVHIASVRDLDKMRKIFDEAKPDIVFHAAAHKHVPLMENDPEEAIKNNVKGTYNCAMLASEYNVDKFVLVSTDKAVNPTNVMGATKRCCEMIVQYFAQLKNGTEYVAVRFGNVLGSNGSVIPLFERQISEGGPITVTHPDIIRYFMTIPEAVNLILQAGAMARGGEIFVLDMGEPVKILSLAENLIRLHGKEPYVDIDIKFSGLRPGEKLFEELLMSEEGLKRTENKKIFIGKQIEIDAKTFVNQLEDIWNAAEENDSSAVLEKLRTIVSTFNHVVINR
ncbi:MAG: nucleoside-diphosphate sugar epimerase/dehydratase [Clostridia bacterium]|nr:nucleoside-diphosphate sugar epimerase/dehydratase [Clostridia bacterium]